MKKSNTLFGRFMLVSFAYFFFFSNASAQFEVLPCDDPENNGIGCYCETAGILCTPDELDGFEFSMSDVSNNGGLSGDLCPESPDTGAPHNVNFFAFTAWCENLTFDVLVSNCSPGTNTGNNINNFGIQMALFADCPGLPGSNNWNPVDCITNEDETCFDSAAEVPTMQTFSANDLEIGGTYYFMVDGCFQSTCKITIDVQGNCGSGEITDWDTGLTGPSSVCLGGTETYIAEDILVGLDGAEEYYYYIDGVLIDEGEEQYTIDINWDTPGSYELCVDVSNLPCIQTTDFPLASCMTIIVNEPGSGDIQADMNTLCPDETSTITVANTNADPALSEYIIIIGPDDTVVQIVEAITTTFTFDHCGAFTAYYFSFVTADNPLLPMVGDLWTLPDCDASCCSLDDVMITFEDTEDPVFTNVPADITIQCSENIIEDEEIAWTDNCVGTGTVQPVVIENYTLCGGTIDRTWTFSDSCGNTETYTQNIEVAPIPEAFFLSPPANSMISCIAAQTYVALDLNYTNMDAGMCEISGIASPTSTSTFDVCGGSITNTWEFTDLCGRVISHNQMVTVEPISDASFINPPSDITISCDVVQTFTPETLMFTNSGTGNCLIEGIIAPTSDGSLDICGNSATYNWEFTDLCGRLISHSQVVSVEPIPEASFINPPGDITINCDEIQTFTPDTLMYTNGGTGNCLIEGTIIPTSFAPLDTCDISVTYTWDYTDDCFRPITHNQTVTVKADVIHSVQSEEGKKRINVFPNPFSNQITIDEGGLKKSDIVIYNLIGENLSTIIDVSLNSENAVIETANLRNGMYILKVRTDIILINKY